MTRVKRMTEQEVEIEQDKFHKLIAEFIMDFVPAHIRQFLIDEAIATNDMTLTQWLPDFANKAFLAGAMAMETRSIPYMNYALDLVMEDFKNESRIRPE